MSTQPRRSLGMRLQAHPPHTPSWTRWWHVHTILIAFLGGIIAAIVITVLGAFAVNYTQQYFRNQHFKLPERPPPGHFARAGLPPVTLPVKYYPAPQYLDPVRNQGVLGSCEAHATVEIVDYAFNAHYGYTGSRQRHCSIRFVYSAYSSIEQGGQDTGMYVADAIRIINTYGDVRHRQFDYPPYIIDDPIPNAIMQQARLSASPCKLNLTFHYAFYGTNAGMAGVRAAKLMMFGLRQPLQGSFYAFPELFAAAADHTTGNYNRPKQNEESSGGHAVEFIGWDDHHRFQNGDVGGFKFRNSWGPNACVHGDCWISYAFVAKYAWNLGGITVNWGTSRFAAKPLSNAQASLLSLYPRVWKTSHPAPLQPPPPGAPRTLPSNASGAWYVGKVESAGPIYENLGPIFNAAGGYYGVSPVGLAAQYGSECSMRTGGDICAAYRTPPDVSFGGCQVTVATAAAYGRGDGTYTAANENYLRAYEENPTQCIWMQAQIDADNKRITGLDFPRLNIAWNCGPGWPISFYYNPTGQCYTNYTDDFLGWYYSALAHWAVNAPPKPPKPAFLAKIWYRWADTHHRPRISPYYPKNSTRLRVQAAYWMAHKLYNTLGSVMHDEVYHARQGYEDMRFVHGHIYTWPKHPSWIQVKRS